MMERFDLEEHIMTAWHTEDDIRLVFESTYDDAIAGKLDADRLAHALLGLESLHSMRMSKLWQTYKKCFKLDEYREANDE